MLSFCLMEPEGNEAGEVGLGCWVVFLVCFVSFGIKLFFSFTALFLCVSDVRSETTETAVLFIELMFSSFLNVNLG